MLWMDARLPIRFGPLDTRAPDEAVLTDGAAVPGPAASFEPGMAGSHQPDCTCCAPRSAAATALAQLFRNRALAPGPPFRVTARAGAARTRTVSREAIRARMSCSALCPTRAAAFVRPL